MFQFFQTMIDTAIFFFLLAIRFGNRNDRMKIDVSIAVTQESSFLRSTQLDILFRTKMKRVRRRFLLQVLVGKSLSNIISNQCPTISNWWFRP
jgi:hypothetical protein